MMTRMHWTAFALAALLPVRALLPDLEVPAVAADVETVRQLRELDGRVLVLGTVRQPPLASMPGREIDARLRAANRADRLAWEEVTTRAGWEAFRDKRLEALRASLGDLTPPPGKVQPRVTGRLEGDGYRVENIVYESRPGLLVTANLYRPARPAASMPAILICHSHQSSKHTSWRPDMAMTWARAGCLVLVPDHLGHGERRQHPFGEDGPHDYHFRYEAGIQLQLVGESLMGWMVRDLMRGVDVLLAQPGIDPKRVVLISEPAGGGDVAAVTGALDQRITGVMVQNFGGPQPETPYPLPPDAVESFNYTGSGSWESTRNLRLSARDGFLPWMIDAACAPRRLIYYHEFYWDREQDPVWKRLQRVYGFYNSPDAVVGLSGRGFVVGSAPENTHWLPANRELLYPVLERWFDIPNPKQEYSKRRPADELLCLTPEVTRELKPQPLHALTSQLATERGLAARRERDKLLPDERRARVRYDWARLLGDVAPQADPVVKVPPVPAQVLGRVTVERIALGTDPGILVPVVLMLPARPKAERVPVVVAVAQQGKHEFLRQQADAIAELLASGVAVCLPDLRGTGETSPGEGFDRRSVITSLAATELMLGQTLLGGRLRDLRSVLRYLRTRPELDGKQLALWGDSFARVNPADRNFQVPHTAADRPAASEPLGGLVVLLAALFEDDIRAVYIRHGLSDYASLLEGPICYPPHDAVVPGVLAFGDLSDVAAALAPRAVWLNEMVDGFNRIVPEEVLSRRYAPARAAFTASGAEQRLLLATRTGEKALPAEWLLGRLKDR